MRFSGSFLWLDSRFFANTDSAITLRKKIMQLWTFLLDFAFLSW
jgi:hypothetical protein